MDRLNNEDWQTVKEQVEKELKMNMMGVEISKAALAMIERRIKQAKPKPEANPVAG